MKKSIQEHYDDEAKTFGKSPQSTMRDLSTRHLEVTQLEEAIKNLWGIHLTPVTPRHCGLTGQPAWRRVQAGQRPLAARAGRTACPDTGRFGD